MEEKKQKRYKVPEIYMNSEDKGFFCNNYPVEECGCEKSSIQEENFNQNTKDRHPMY